MNEVAAGKDAQARAEAAAKEAGDRVDELLSGIPNALDGDVPDGADEDDNRELRAWGEPRQFDFEAREHDDLGEALGLMDFERAAGMSGARFVILTGALARLERAIGDFMLDIQTQRVRLHRGLAPAAWSATTPSSAPANCPSSAMTCSRPMRAGG